MRYLCLLLIIAVALTGSVSADVRQVYKEFHHERGAFKDSKNWAHTIYLPQWMAQQGYKFTHVNYTTEGSARIERARLNPTSYSFVFRLKKESFFLPAEGRVKITLSASPNGQPYTGNQHPNQPYPNQPYPNQPYPNTGYPNTGYPNTGYPNTGYPNTGYPNTGYSNPNVVPILVTPANNFTFTNERDIKLSWNGQGNPQKYFIKVYDNYGRVIVQKEVTNNYYSVTATAMKAGMYKWQVKQYLNNAWSNFSIYRSFYVQKQYANPNNPNNGYPSNGYPNNGYPNNGYPNNGSYNNVGIPVLSHPANNAQVNASALNFQWQGNARQYQIRIYTQNGPTILTQNVSTNTFRYTGAQLQVGQRYLWEVRQMMNNNQWSRYSSPFAFTVANGGYNNGYPNNGYPNTGYPNTGYPNGNYVTDSPYGWYSSGKQFYKNLNGQFVNEIVIKWNDFFADARCDIYVDNMMIGTRDVTSSTERFQINRVGNVLRIDIHDSAVKIENVMVQANAGYNNGYPNTGYPNTGYPNTGYPNTGYPNTGYPNTGYPNNGYPNTGNTGYPSPTYPSGSQAQIPRLVSPTNGATITKRNINLTWTSNSTTCHIIIKDNTNRTIVNQQVNGKSFIFTADQMRPGYTYSWRVKQMINNQWSNMSSPFMFRIRGTSRSNQAALDDAAGMIFESKDVDAASAAIDRIDDPAKKKEALAITAMGFENEEKYAQAINVYREIIKVDKKSEPIMLLKIGNAYLKLNNKKQAKAAFDELIKKYPNSTEASEARRIIKDESLDELQPLKVTVPSTKKQLN